MDTISVNDRIRKAVADAGLSQRALAQQTGLSQPTISRILSGERAPKMPELVQLAWATGATVAALTGTSNVAERVQCAARATDGSAMDGMRDILLYFLELDAYLEDQAIPFTGMSPEAAGKEAAEAFRRDHHLGTQPIGDLITAVEQAIGIDVAVVDADPDEHGMTMRDPARGVSFIAVAKTPHPMRQRSNLAHELSHFLFEDWADAEGATWDERRPEERRADSSARHLLIPHTGLKEFVGSPPEMTLSLLSRIVQWFLVSPQMAAIALEQAGYIDAATKGEWMTLNTPGLATRFGWRDQYQALQYESDRIRAPQRLLARAVKGYVAGVVSIGTLAKLRGLAPEIVKAEMEESDLVPDSEPIPWASATALPEADVDLSGLAESDEDHLA